MAQIRKNFSYLNKPTSYSNVAIILHWLIGVSIIFMFLLGWFMQELPKEAAKSSNAAATFKEMLGPGQWKTAREAYVTMRDEQDKQKEEKKKEKKEEKKEEKKGGRKTRRRRKKKKRKSRRNKKRKKTKRRRKKK